MGITSATTVNNENILILREIKAEYQPIRTAIKLKIPLIRERKNFVVGNTVILKGLEPIRIGTLIKLRFYLKDQNKHRFGNKFELSEGSTYRGVGQVLDILNTQSKKYKMLIRLIELEDKQ